MTILTLIARFLAAVIQGCFPEPAGALTGTSGYRNPGSGGTRNNDPLRHANTGGPRSRVVSTAVVSRMLSDGSEILGLKSQGTYRLPRLPAATSLREFAMALLNRAGFLTPEEAWEAHRPQLPSSIALVVDSPPGPELDGSGEDPVPLLRTALVLGRCSGRLFSPDRPLIWSERRLARSVRLVLCDPATFARHDDD
jgi:hypothetical protein